jgi:hypothetical protein
VGELLLQSDQHHGNEVKPMKIRITSDVQALVKHGIREEEAERLAGNIIDAEVPVYGSVLVGPTTGLPFWFENWASGWWLNLEKKHFEILDA